MVYTSGSQPLCREEMKQAKQNFISMTSHRLINVHWKINTYIIYKMVIAGDIRRQIYVCLGCPPFMADIINEQKQ